MPDPPRMSATPMPTCRSAIPNFCRPPRQSEFRPGRPSRSHRGGTRPPPSPLVASWIIGKLFRRRPGSQPARRPGTSTRRPDPDPPQVATEPPARQHGNPPGQPAARAIQSVALTHTHKSSPITYKHSGDVLLWPFWPASDMQLRNPCPTRRTCHLPVSENLTQFLQAHPATPGWTCSRG